MALIPRVVAEMTPAESAAYDAFMDRSGYRYSGTSVMNGFLAGYRAGTKESTVTTAWDALSHHDQLDHIEFCDGCDTCADGRGFGACTSCGSDPVEALPPHGESRCCGSQVSMRGDQS